ncbi:MAG: hypothetical protein Q4D98_07235 [Planctomycetia bacterium]|nr:hypothetical protein [Planctomycetia bacterium]
MKPIFSMFFWAVFAGIVWGGDGFALKHDEAVYGPFLPVVKVADAPPASDVTISGNRLFAVGKRALTVYDISDPMLPKKTASLYGLTEGRQVVVYKENLYITSRMGGMYVVDIRDPDRPRLRAHYDTMELATGIVCDNDVAYVSQRQFGTEFIDISDPDHPRHLGFIVSGEAQSVDIANGLLYAGDWGSRELTIIDVRNPKNPAIIGSGALDGLGDGVYVRGNIAYAATGPHKLRQAPATGHGLDIFSVENPREPKLLGRLKFPAQAVHRNPDFWGVTVDDHHMAYVSDSFNGIFCVDVSDPANPKCVGHCVLPTNERTGNPDAAGSVESGDGCLYVAGHGNGLYVVKTPLARRVPAERECPKLSDPVRPDLPFDEALVRDFAILPTDGQALAAAAWKEGLVWLAAGSEGLLLVDINGPTPVVKSTLATRGFAYDVKIFGNMMFTAEGDNGVGIYRLAEDGEPVPVNHFDTGQPVRQVTVPDPQKWLIAKSGNSIRFFFDISDPVNPKRVWKDQNHRGILYGRDLVDGVSPSGLTACVTQSTGLLWYDFSGPVPTLKTVTFPEKVSFYDGACWVGETLFFFQHGRYGLLKEAEERSREEITWIPVEGLPYFGKASSHEQTICFTDRRNGNIHFLDVTDPEKPQTLRKYSLQGHPELAIFVNGRAVIPCGHAGLLVEKK